MFARLFTSILRNSTHPRTVIVALAVVMTLASASTAGAATGDLDPTFSGDGIVTATGGPTSATATVFQADGKLIVTGVGAFDDGSVSKVGTYVARYTAAGALDSTFGTGGIKKFNAMPAFESVRGVKIDGSGRILVSGYGATTDPSDESDIYVVRLTAAGAADATFGGGDGIAVLDMGNHDRAGGITVSGTRILVATSQDFGGNWANEWTVAAFNNTGARDLTFSGDGEAEVPTTKLGTFDGVRDIAVQTDGKILLGGTTGTAFAATRMTAAGVLDATFDGDGVAITTIGDGGAGNKLLLQKDGKVLVVGYATQTGHADNDFAAVRYLATGALDATFGTGGKLAFTISAGSNDRAFGAALAADEKIVLGGFTNPTSGMNFATARLNWNGNRDTSFSGDGLVVTNTLATSNEQIESVAVGPNDRIVAAGENLNGWAVVAYTGHANRNLSAANVSIAEPDSGTANLTFTVNLSVASTTPVTVRYATAAGTATTPADFSSRSGTVSFAAGQTAKTVVVPVVGDTVREPNETFSIVFSKPTNAGISKASAVGTIVNDD